VKPIILPAAELESVQAAIWYDDRRAGLGDDFLNEVEDAIARIGRQPDSFSKLDTTLARTTYVGVSWSDFRI